MGLGNNSHWPGVELSWGIAGCTVVGLGSALSGSCGAAPSLAWVFGQQCPSRPVHAFGSQPPAWLLSTGKGLGGQPLPPLGLPPGPSSF